MRYAQLRFGDSILRVDQLLARVFQKPGEVAREAKVGVA